jgi:two-component sensor histidine kinase
MNHRIKNLFTVAGSIVALSARSAATPEALAKSVRERLGALARAQALTLSAQPGDPGQRPQATTLHVLIETILSPFFENGDAPHFRVTGPDISIASTSVTSFALLLHEFATNAAKYGALSVPTGRIDIECSEEHGRFILTWTEHGGPPVGQGGEDEGFGGILVRSTVERQLGGEIVREWKPEGLALRLIFARDRLAGQQEIIGHSPILSGVGASGKPGAELFALWRSLLPLWDNFLGLPLRSNDAINGFGMRMFFCHCPNMCAISCLVRV